MHERAHLETLLNRSGLSRNRRRCDHRNRIARRHVFAHPIRHRIAPASAVVGRRSRLRRDSFVATTISQPIWPRLPRIIQAPQGIPAQSAGRGVKGGIANKPTISSAT
jgi:hypothetical protein